MLSSIGSSQTNGASIPGEDKTFEPLDSTRMNDTVTQTTFTKTCEGISSRSVTCQKSVYNSLESKVAIFNGTVQAKASSLQGLIQRNSPLNKECQPSLERKGDTGYVTVNLEPVALPFGKNASVPLQKDVVNRADELPAFTMELIKQVSPATSLRHPVSTFEKAQTQGLKDIPSLAMAGQKGTKYLCASSVSGVTLAKEMCSAQKEIPIPCSSSPSDNSVAKEAFPSVKGSHYSLLREEMKRSQEFFLRPKGLFSISSEEIMEPSQVEGEASSSASATLEKNYSPNCVPSRSNTSDGSLELKGDRSSLNSDVRNFESFNSVFNKQTSLSINGEEVSLELEEDSDIDLTLTLSPPTSPREEMPTGEIQQHQEAPLSKLELQDMGEDILEPDVTLIENREVSSAKYASVLPTVSGKPLENKETKGDNLQTVTLILPKETCTLEIAEEVNVTSDFPFGSIIEEVSPASSPDPHVAIEEKQPCQAVSPCSLKLPHIQCEKSHKFSQNESGDLAITEKENSFVGPPHPVGHDNLTQVQQMQLSAEMPLVLNNHPERKDRHLTLPSKVTDEIVPCDNDEGFSFSEKVPCCDTEVSQPAVTASYRADFKTSQGKLATSGNPLQPVSTANRNSNLNHVALETSEPSFSSRKIMEAKSLADTVLSTTAPSGIVCIPLRQQSSPKSMQKSEGTYLQAQSLSSDSVNGADTTQAHMYSEIPKLAFSSGSATPTHCTGPINTETRFQTQELSVVRMASWLKNSKTEAELRENTVDLGGVSAQSNTSSPHSKQKPIHVRQDQSTCETEDLLNGGLPPMYLHADSYQNIAVCNDDTNKEPSAFFVTKSCAPLVCGVPKEQMENKSAGEELRAEEDSETPDGDTEVSVNSDIHYEPLSEDSDQDFLGDCRNLKLDMEGSCTWRYSHPKKKEGATQDDYDSFQRLNDSDNEDWSYSKQVPRLETNVSPRNWSVGLKKEPVCVPRYIQIRDCYGIPRTYTNFTVTKELEEINRTSHSLRRYPNVTAKGGLLSFWTDTWQVADLTQNTLDLEYLRFEHKLKQIVKKRDSEHSASSTSLFLKELPVPLTAMAESPVPYPAYRSRSPLVVTVMHSDAPQQSEHLTGHMPSNLDSSSFWRERCDHRNYLTSSERNQTVSFHLNKLKYNSTLKDSRNDISLILNEYAEFNKVVMDSNQVVFQDKGPDVASGEAVSQEMYSSSPRGSPSYEDMITDLCTNLHVKLRSVVKEACTSTFLFYLVETEDKSFFLRTKVSCKFSLEFILF